MAENITEEQLRDYYLAFSSFDKDGNGSISVGELRAVVESLGHTVTDEEIKAMIAEVDADQSGNIDFPEFLALMAFRLMLNDVGRALKFICTHSALKRTRTKF